MTRSFFDTFQNIRFEDHDLRDLLGRVSVTNITMNRERTLLKVHLESDRLIERREIECIEKTISGWAGFDEGTKTKVVEKFCLSEQYTAKNLMAAYKPSILRELYGYRKSLYTIFKQADIRFTGSSDCRIIIEDTLLAKDCAEELKRILEKIFTERCQVPLQLVIETRSSERAKSAGTQGKKTSAEYPDSQQSSISAQMPSDQNTDQAKVSIVNHSEGNHSDLNKNSAKGTKKKRGAASRPLKESDDPDLLYGRDFDDDAIDISALYDRTGLVTIRGQLISLDSRSYISKSDHETQMEIIIFSVTDFTDTMTTKVFMKKEYADEFLSSMKKGTFLKLKGNLEIDKFDSELSLSRPVGIKKIPDFRTVRFDDAPKKRVELHCHTKMSRMDAVSSPSDIVKTALKWGHAAIAITDHGVVQGLPDAYGSVPKDSDFKVILGCEAYLVDDELQAVDNAKAQKFDDTFVVFDLETTGFSPVDDRIIEIGAVRVEHGEITERFSEFVNPKRPIPFRIEQLTSINDAMVVNAETIEVILPKFLEFADGAALVGHNVAFDIEFIRENCDRLGIAHDFTTVDTMTLARYLLPGISRVKLDLVARALSIPLGHHHRAVDDADCTALIFVKFLSMLQDLKIDRLDQINERCRPAKEQVKKLHPYHCILLAENDAGRVNLYRCVSHSHLDYIFNGRPMLPKSFLRAHREGLIIGSACSAGELYQAVRRGASENELKRLVDFYDYLEIQPLDNNMYLTVQKYDKNHNPTNEPCTVEDLKKYNRKIVELGERYRKPVCATCDVHFLNPEDWAYRDILTYGFDDHVLQPPIYLHTTQEMLDAFSYLGAQKAEEVVITNTNAIAARCAKISPVRPDKCAPVIPNSDGILTKLCYDKAHEIYGETLPGIVEKRLERELNSIISNGFAVMYIIAQKLVWKSVADGYLVGSRGSVGSSFVAFLSGITEVNSLQPHYLCPECHYVDFESEEVRKFSGMAGCDMPDKACPVCGTMLKKLGFDIPFETFLGFNGDKEPDIDLNFSGEYQSKAHKYTEVIFGANQTFRAGTCSGLQEKTAIGLTIKYLEEKGEHKRKAEVERLAGGIIDVMRTTGQHPGGIIVLPYGEEIDSFTPVQHPPNDDRIITTHFDYHKIDHNLLKLDILGHDDPTMIRMLEELTGRKATEIPLDDRAVMSLFQNTEALGITPDDIGGRPLGSLGIPEFGTDFAIQMLVDAKPQYFSDLVRIAGLAHGTDVWLGNAKDLILNGICTINTAICTRDDIMIYLIDKGVEPGLSFEIMEKVRKGKGLKPEWETAMREHDVPEWYIESCKKIKYMFPKAHAAAYVMMAWRIAWFKINEPLAYYAAYFSIRSPGFDYEMMCMGQEALLRHIKELEAKDPKAKDPEKKLQPKEEEQLKTMNVVREMYARGFEFAKIDLSKCKATKFIITEDGKLMPALNKISSLGDGAASKIVDAVKDGPFLSQENLRERSGCSKTIVEILIRLGILEELPESNQLSIFDFM